MRRVGLLGIALLAAAAPALAFDTNKLGQSGSLPLSDLDELISQSAALKQDVAAALTAAKQQASDFICSGNRFPSQWVNLGGMRAASYTCELGGKWLIIEADTPLTDKAGHAYETITPAAMKKVANVKETNPKWKWTTEDPFKDEK
jgi:hypothetical protein